MGTLTIEAAEEVKVGTCADCGKEEQSVHGFVYSDGDAYAVYLATICTGHAEKLVCVAIGIGKWSDDSGPDDRQSATLFIRPAPAEFQMTFQDRTNSPWRESERWLGRMLDRTEALASPLKGEFFHVADHIVMNDPRIQGYLSG